MTWTVKSAREKIKIYKYINLIFYNKKTDQCDQAFLIPLHGQDVT